MQTVMDEEKAQMLISSKVEKEEKHLKEWLKIFSQEDEQEISAELKPATEGEI
jgi:hypothetical protein